MKCITYFIQALLLLSIFTSFVSAEVQSLPTVKVDSCLDLEQTCASCTYVNLESIRYPNGTSEYLNYAMDINGNKFTLRYCNNTQVGVYIATTCGDVDGTETCVDYNFKTTPSGYDNVGIFLFIFIIIISLIYLTGFKLENAWIMSLGSILVLIFGFFIIKFGVDIIKDTQTTWAIGLVVWAIGLYSLYLSAEEQLKQWG